MKSYREDELKRQGDQDGYHQRSWIGIPSHEAQEEQKEKEGAQEVTQPSRRSDVRGKDSCRRNEIPEFCPADLAGGAWRGKNLFTQVNDRHKGDQGGEDG